jgi:hypothetical protein
LEGKPVPSTGRGSSETEETDVGRVVRRCYSMGKDLRWFFHAAYTFVCLSGQTSVVKRLDEGQLLKALAAAGANVVSTSPSSRPSSSSSIPIVNPTGSSLLSSLRSLPQTQSVLLLAAKRVLDRNALRDTDQPDNLCFDKLVTEYEQTFAKKHISLAGADNYSEEVLFQAFLHLLETDIIKPLADHTGGGANQYKMENTAFEGTESEGSLRTRVVVLNVDVEAELEGLVKDKEIGVSQALRKWGLVL